MILWKKKEQHLPQNRFGIGGEAIWEGDVLVLSRSPSLLSSISMWGKTGSVSRAGGLLESLVAFSNSLALVPRSG